MLQQFEKSDSCGQNGLANSNMSVFSLDVYHFIPTKRQLIMEEWKTVQKQAIEQFMKVYIPPT